MTGFSQLGSIGRVYESRNFAIFIAGLTPSHIGVWMQRVAVGWLTWELTESTAWLGVIAFADFVPVVVISPFAGVVADRFDRLKVSKITQICLGLQSVVLWLLTATGLITVEILLALTLWFGIGASFFQPVRQALIASLVPREDLPAAVALSATIWHGARFVGPALAGIVIVTAGIAPAFALNAAAYGLFVYALWRLKPADQTLAAASQKGIVGDVVEGYRYALNHPGIAPLLLILLCGGLVLRPLTEFLPGFAEGIYGRGATGLAWMTSSAGLGAMAGGIWLALRGNLSGLTAIAISSILVGAASVLGVALAPNFWMSTACLLATGFALVANGTVILTLVQTSVEPTMLGRVLSVYGMFWLGGVALGSLVMGSVSSIIGLKAPFVVGAVISIFAWAWVIKRKRAIERELEID